MTTVIKIENLWKEYRLGVIGHGTLTADLQSWWAKMRGKEDPNSMIPVLKGQERQIEGDRFWALRGIDLEVKQGEILGIIGKNGAGKSTLLKILSRVTAPTKGSIKVRGRIASLLEVGTGFHPELTGRENIFMNGVILGMSRHEIRAKFDEIVNFSGITEFIDTPVKRYSSGMYVRLAFAVAAHLEPEIMIVDEVLAVGDAEFQKKCLGKMGDIANEGRTVLFVSHNMGSISSLCNRGVTLANGVIDQEGAIGKIVNEYLIPHNASLDLSEVVSRKGTGILKFISAKLYSDCADKDSDVLSGKELYIELQFNNGEGADLNEVRIDLRIDSVLGARLIWLSTSLNENWFFRGNTATFLIKKLPLNEGNYYVTLYCKINNEVADWIQNAFSFYVKNLDIGKDKKVIDPKQSALIVDHMVM